MQTTASCRRKRDLSKYAIVVRFQVKLWIRIAKFRSNDLLAVKVVCVELKVKVVWEDSLLYSCGEGVPDPPSAFPSSVISQILSGCRIPKKNKADSFFSNMCYTFKKIDKNNEFLITRMIHCAVKYFVKPKKIYLIGLF